MQTKINTCETGNGVSYLLKRLRERQEREKKIEQRNVNTKLTRPSKGRHKQVI